MLEHREQEMRDGKETAKKNMNMKIKINVFFDNKKKRYFSAYQVYSMSKYHLAVFQHQVKIRQKQEIQLQCGAFQCL